MAFVALEKAIVCIRISTSPPSPSSKTPPPSFSLIRVAVVLEWLVKVVQAMYVGARSRTRVNGSFSEELKSKLGRTRDQY